MTRDLEPLNRCPLCGKRMAGPVAQIAGSVIVLAVAALLVILVVAAGVALL